MLKCDETLIKEQGKEVAANIVVKAYKNNYKVSSNFNPVTLVWEQILRKCFL